MECSNDQMRRTARSRMGGIDALGTAAKWAVRAFAILVAVNQIGIASTLVTALFIAIVGAVALALGLSFGLGGGDDGDAGNVGRTGQMGYTGVEHRHALADRRSNRNGRRALG